MSQEERKRKYEAILQSNTNLLHYVCRLKDPVTTEEQVSQYILVPALAGFVLWLLDLALRHKIKRLYFLSRDGYFMYTAAKIACKEKNLPIECRYLYCSRYSLRVPMFHRDMEQALKDICASGSDITPEKVFIRAGFFQEEIKEIFLHVRPPYALNEILSLADLSVLHDKLAQSSYFLENLERNSKKLFPNFCGYLKQEGLLDEIPMAIVDSGWVGSIQKTLWEGCLALGKKSKIEGYYWGLYDLPDNVETERYHCYYFSPENRLFAKTFFSNCLFEAVFSAPHGMTVRYEKREQFYPVLTKYTSQNIQFYENLRHMLESYICILLQNLSAEDMGKEAASEKKAIGKLFRLFMCSPSKEEAVYFGNFIFDEDMTGCSEKKLAYPLTEKELLANHILFRIFCIFRNKSVKESGWYEGSAVLHGKWPAFYRYGYFFTRFLRFLRKQIKNRVRKAGKI